ncbi:MAG: polysaccharide pyruvyl transferase family protein [Planctomycetota bacterium]|nr:polysaccharide pyruvyl transferase family protein [Planctomycetota bacterium]
MRNGHTRTLLAGAAPGTGNLGVDALALSTLHALASRGLEPPIVLDFGRGRRAAESPAGVVAARYERLGIRTTRRLYQRDSYGFAHAMASLGLSLGPALRAMRGASALLDLSGGDSFTDLYGPRRFTMVCDPKRLALKVRTPLILLPQTYGPFADARNRGAAGALVRYASQAWARDGRSYGILKELLGSSFDPDRHRLGVDVAFLLPRTDAARLRSKLPSRAVGVNVSGLIWNDPVSAREQYRFRSDYREALTRIVRAIAQEVEVVLVPHVLAPRGHYESDRDACESLRDALDANVRERVRVCDDPTDPCEAKGLIAACDWFIGTRMHSTIAGLSSGVPTAAISYSDKTLGVFETCGQGAHVHDPRTLDTDTLVERVLWSFSQREAARASLAAGLPPVIAMANEQMDAIVATIRANMPNGSGVLR